MTSLTAQQPATPIEPLGLSRPPRANALTWVVTSTGLAVIPIGVLHVGNLTRVDPLLDPISYYALVPGGFGLLLVGCAMFGVAGLGLAGWLLRSGLPGVRLPAALLASFAVAFALVGLFPTDPFGTQVPSVSAVIHRISAGWGVIVVPIAGLLVARSTAASACRACPARLVGLARVVAALIVIFFAIHLPLALMGSRIPAFGLIERAGFALVIVSLILMAVALGCRGAERATLASAGRPGGVEQETVTRAERELPRILGS